MPDSGLQDDPQPTVYAGMERQALKNKRKMRYFIRALKTFIYFTLLFVLIIAVFVISGTVELDIETMFRDGYTSLWEILAIMVAISAVYPKLSYTRSIPGIKGNLSTNRVQIISLMQDFGYEVEHESVGKMTFRLKSAGARLARKYEDRVTFEQNGEVLSVEGLKKDLVRIISRMEYRLNNED